MDIKLEIYGNEMQSAQLEVLIKILAHQKATISLLCDKYAKTDLEADQLYREAMDECNTFGSSILQDLYERRGHVEPGDILPNK